MRKLIDQNISNRAQFAGVARFAQNTRRGIAAPVGKAWKVDFHQRQPIKIGQQRARIVTRLDPDGGGVGLIAAGIDGDGAVIHRLVIAETELHFIGAFAEVFSHTAPP